MPSGVPWSTALPAVGVEEEYLLVDATTGYPMPVAEQVCSDAQLQPALAPDDVQHELLQVQVEVATPVCHELDEVGGHLLRLRHELSAAANEHGARLVASGTAPWHEGVAAVTDLARYREINLQAPGLVGDHLINGMHVHVDVASRAEGIEVVNRLRPDLPLLLAMSANSPFWRGRDTGFQSWRTVHFERWPVAGPPPYFRDEEEYERRVEALVSTGCIRDRRQIYWHARVSERFPTVEVRCADVQLRVDDAVLLAGLARALVMTALRDLHDGVPAAVIDPELIRAATWQAARHGLDGELHDFALGRCSRAGDMIYRLMERMEPALVAAGDDKQVGKLVDRLLREGSGAARQRDLVRKRGLGDLVPFLAGETTATWPH